MTGLPSSCVCLYTQVTRGSKSCAGNDIVVSHTPQTHRQYALMANQQHWGKEQSVCMCDYVCQLTDTQLCLNTQVQLMLIYFTQPPNALPISLHVYFKSRKHEFERLMNVNRRLWMRFMMMFSLVQMLEFVKQYWELVIWKQKGSWFEHHWKTMNLTLGDNNGYIWLWTDIFIDQKLQHFNQKK